MNQDREEMSRHKVEECYNRLHNCKLKPLA